MFLAVYPSFKGGSEYKGVSEGPATNQRPTTSH